jgi:hypothetical protein
MKKIIYTISFLSFFVVVSFISSSKNESLNETWNNKSTQSIQGLWEGTYTVGSGQPLPPGTQLYFAFSIYPNGTLSYKSKGYYNGNANYITFAYGTWKLVGTKFSFTIKPINAPAGKITQYGTAKFNISKGTLTNGNIFDTLDPNNPTLWSMSRVN